MTGPRTVGLDIGGTATRVVVVDAGDVIASATISTPQIRAQGWRPLATAIDDVLRASGTDAADVAGIGIGASGPIDAAGVIRNEATLPALSGIGLTRLLEAHFGVRCAIDNDAVTAALAEAAPVDGAPATDLLMLTLGTGVGVAVIVGGRPFRGSDHVHPEGGHLTVPGAPAPCYCGRATCFEQTASRGALQRLARAHTGDDDLTALAASAQRGDAVAVAVFEEYGRRLGDGLIELCTQHRPQTVVLGGSAGEHLPHFRESLHTRLAALTDAPIPTLVAARQGDLGGAVGAALLISAHS